MLAYPAGSNHAAASLTDAQELLFLMWVTPWHLAGPLSPIPSAPRHTLPDAFKQSGDGL